MLWIATICFLSFTGCKWKEKTTHTEQTPTSESGAGQEVKKDDPHHDEHKTDENKPEAGKDIVGVPTPAPTLETPPTMGPEKAVPTSPLPGAETTTQDEKKPDEIGGSCPPDITDTTPQQGKKSDMNDLSKLFE